MKLINPTLQLTFSDNQTQTVSSQFIVAESIKFNYVLLSGMKSASNRVSLELAKSSFVTEAIISSEDNIKAVLRDGNNVLFTGYLSTNFSWTVTSSGEQALKFTIEDVGTRLLQKSFIDTGYHLFNCSATSAIQAICSHCGITVSDRCFTINNVVVNTVESHQTCKDILSRMVYELGLVYYFDNLGEFRLFEIATNPTDDIRILDDNDMCSLSVTKKLRRYRSSRVSYTKLEEADNYLVYRNTTGKDDAHPYCNMTLHSKEHFDGVQIFSDEQWVGDSFVGACNAESETNLVGSNKILAVTNVVPNIVSTSDTSCTITPSGPYLQIDVKNNSNSPIVISRLDAYGSIVFEKENAVIRTSEDGMSSSTFEENLEYVHDQLTAKRFANIATQFNQYSEAQYSFTLRENLPLGTIVHISENLHTSLDVDVLLIEKDFSDKNCLVSYKAVGLSAFDLDKGVFTRSYKNPQISLKGSDGAKGIPGEKGEKGEQGEKGDTGEQGDVGPKGDAFTFEDFTEEELNLLKGDKGDDGPPSISAGLSVNSLQIPVDIDGNVESNLISIIDFEAYLGTSKQSCSANIASLPSGVNKEINNTTQKITLTFTKGSSLDNDTSGVIEVVITCLSQSFVRSISWVKSLDAKKIKQDIEAQADEIISLTSSLDSKASISDLSSIQTQIQEQNSSITSLTSDLANKALKSDIQSLEGEVEDNASAINGLATRVSSAEGTITAHGTSISQNADAIQSKASKSSVDTLSGTVTSQGTQITQTANSLSSLATRVTTAEGTISSHGTSITQNANAIQSKASKSSVDTLTGTVNSHTTQITQTANSLSSLATRVTTAEGTISSHGTSITQNANTIATKASKSSVDSLSGTVTNQGTTLTQTANGLSALTTRVTTAEGTIASHSTSITTNANAINLRATKTEVNTLSGKVNQNTSNISQNATNISLKVGAIDSNGNAVSNAKIEVGSVDGQSKIQLSADKVLIDGSVTASKIDVESLFGREITVGNFIKGGACDSNGNNSTNGLGFYLGSNGLFKAYQMDVTKAQIHDATITGKSSLEGTVTNKVFKTTETALSSDSLYTSSSTYKHFVESDLSSKVRAKQATESMLKSFSSCGNWRMGVWSDVSYNIVVDSVPMSEFVARTPLRISGAYFFIDGVTYRDATVDVSSGQRVKASTGTSYHLFFKVTGCVFYNTSTKDLYFYQSHQFYNSLPSDVQTLIGFTLSSNLKYRVMQSAEVTRLTDGLSNECESGAKLHHKIDGNDKNLKKVIRNGLVVTFVTDSGAYTSTSSGYINFHYSYKRLSEVVGVRTKDLNAMESNSKIGNVTPYEEIHGTRVYGAVFN